MGIYIYKMSKTPEIQTDMGGIHVYKYYDKVAPRFNHDAQDKQEDRCARYCANFPNKKEAILVTAYKQEGSPVYLQEKARPIWYDGGDPQGKVVGTLTKKGRSWSIEPLAEPKN